MEFALCLQFRDPTCAKASGPRAHNCSLKVVDKAAPFFIHFFAGGPAKPLWCCMSMAALPTAVEGSPAPAEA